MSTLRVSSLALAFAVLATSAAAQASAAPEEPRPMMGMAPGGAVQPVMDQEILTHALFNQLEGRFNGTNTEFRWDAVPTARPAASENGNGKRQARNDEPLQERRETRAEQRKNRHRRGIGPAPPNLDVQPFAEGGIGGAEDDRGEDHAPPEHGPAAKPREHKRDGDRSRRDQNVAAGAMDQSEHDLARGAGPPEGVKR